MKWYVIDSYDFNRMTNADMKPKRKEPYWKKLQNIDDIACGKFIKILSK